MVTHGRQAFVDTNISGTLTLLEAALVVKAADAGPEAVELSDLSSSAAPRPH